MLIINNKYIDVNNLSPIEIYKLVLSGDLNRFPRYFWDGQDGFNKSAEITKYLIENILKWTDEDIKENFNIDMFRNNKLAGMMRIFNGSPFDVLDNAYPNKFKPWELKKSQVKDGYWNNETIIKATKWLFKEKLKWSSEDINKYCSIQLFKDNNLYGMLHHHFNYSPYELLKYVFPNENWDLLKRKYKG